MEIMDNHDGTLSVFGTILDFVAPTPDPTKLQTPAQLAALSRLLSANDWQERTGHSATVDGRRGKVSRPQRRAAGARPPPEQQPRQRRREPLAEYGAKSAYDVIT